MAGNSSNLNTEGEIRYIVQWFNTFSEMEREDFLPIFVDSLKATSLNGNTSVVYVNGIVSGLANAQCTDKPMSLFQCRMKLYREWYPKWSDAVKASLKEKICEIDAAFAEKLQEELKALENGNGHAETAEMVEDIEEAAIEVSPPIQAPIPAVVVVVNEEIALNA